MKLTSVIAAFFLIITLPSFAYAERERPIASWKFDTLSFTQTTGKLYEHEDVTVDFPVTAELYGPYANTRENSDTAIPTRLYFDATELEEKNVAVEYKVFPQAMDRFPSRERVEQRWRNGYVFEHVSVKPDLDSPALSNKKNDTWLIFYRFFLAGDLVARNEEEYARIMSWYDAIDTAIEERKAVIITFLLNPVSILASRPELVKVVSYEKWPQELPNGAFHTLSVRGEITDIRVAD